MKHMRLRRAVARVLMDAKELGHGYLTVGQIVDRLMDGGWSKHIPSTRRLGQILKTTPGFVREDRRYVYDRDRHGCKMLSMWGIREWEVRTWL